MESTSLKLEHPNSQRHRKALIFDRRYGWVFDEWKSPSEEALQGARGTFCILPLAKALLKTASQTIDSAANSVVKVIETPELLSPEVLQTNINDQLNKITCSVKNLEFGLKKFTTNFRWELTTSDRHGENYETVSDNP